MRWIAQAVRDHTPQQFGLEYGLWTLSLIVKLINRQFDKSLSLAAVSRIMKLLGFLAQKPLYQAWQQDAAMVFSDGKPRPIRRSRHKPAHPVPRSFLPTKWASDLTTIPAPPGHLLAKRRW